MEKFPGEYGIKRVKLLLEKLDNPQEKIKIIHIAGTSGKGSTATITAQLLKAHGKKVGLHVKPHMYDLRERFQINNEIISEELFVTYSDNFFVHMEEVNNSGYGKLTYFEVLIALAFYIFEKEKVDYAVIETGVGGLFDGSNTVHNPAKISVITSIGFDHTAILGKTIKEITTQKAGIIQEGNTVIALSQTEEINTIIKNAADIKKATLSFISKNNFHITTSDISGSLFDFNFLDIRLENLHLGLAGDFQVQNAAIALAILIQVCKRDSFTIEKDRINVALSALTIPGRFDIISRKNKQIILDGAHNRQKMESFITNLHTYFPGKKFTFLLGFKEGKDITSILDLIFPIAEKIYITDFFNNQADFVSLSVDLHSLAELIQKKEFTNVEIIYNAADAILDIVEDMEDSILVITGSLYLLSDVYKAIRRSGSAEV